MSSILKKCTAYLVTFAMLITLVPFSALPVSAQGEQQTVLSGSGTENDPILIKTLADLETLRDSVNGGETYKDKYITLTADIDMSEKYGKSKSSWTPIGGVQDAEYNPSVFEGTFDGGGHTVSGLYIESGDPYQGLFGYVEKSGTVKNLNVSGEVIVKNDVVGLVAGYNLGTISNVRASGNADGIYQVGLIAGKNGADIYYFGVTKAKIENSHADGTVNGYDQVGLIAGLNKTLISKCSSSGTFSLDNSTDICSAGGICGENNGDNAVVEYSYNAAKYADKTNNNKNVRVGGISGENSSNAKISYCYNTVTIEAYNAAGIACLNYNGTIKQCYQYGRTKGPGATGFWEFEGDVNPIAKNKSGTEEIGKVIESYYYGDYNNAEYPNESGTSLGSLGYQDELAGFDFDTVWKMDAVLGRPFLRNNLERGTADKPHEVTTLDALQSLCYAVNNGNTYEGEYIKLKTDICYDYKRRGAWTPIGTYDAENESNSKPFKGNFDGEDHLIFEWGIDAPESDYQGLFGYTDGATIKNIRMSGEVNCGNYVGMIAAYSKNSTIENVSAIGSVNGKQYVGGIAGKTDSGTIRSSQNRASISGNEYVGGIAGHSGGRVCENFNAAEVKGNDVVGGIVGLSDGDGPTISDSYNIGGVTAAGTGSVSGGICGEMNDTSVSRVYNIGAVSSLDGETTHGAIYGKQSKCNVSNAYCLADAASTKGGIKLAAEKFKVQDSFNNFDFADIWAMNPYLGRPVLRSCKEYAGGAEDGTEENPYTINDLDDLEVFRDSVNGGETYEGKYVKLTADIDLSEKYGADINGQAVNWTAIGDNNSDKPFNGIFDGGNHKITGLYIKMGVYSQSLFGYIGGDGTVKNLTVSGEITETSGSGIVVGKNKGTLQNVSASGKISASQYIGGICGENYGTIENSSNEAAVTANETVGGICGDNNGSIKNCCNTGSVTGNMYVGGICGKNSTHYGITVQSCYNAALVTGNECVGGICGLNYEASISNCYNVGEVTATNTTAGGICGGTTGEISNCYNYANVTSNGKKAAICSSTYPPNPPKNNYYNGDVFDGDAYISDENEAFQTGRLSESDFADQTKFGGFDFENTWVMYEKAGRPMLKGMEEPDGSEYNPLKIRALSDLEEFSASVNGGNDYTGKKVFLLADIDMSETYGKGKKSWTPIGHNFAPYDYSTWFNGTFEGNGHKITGLYIEGDAEDQGLFGNANTSAVIRNLTVSGDVSGTNGVGLLVGWNIGVIENVTAYGSVNGSAMVGGIVGYNDVTSSIIKQCTNYAAISGEDRVGGIVGRASTSTVQECRNMGTIYASDYYAGGIVGAYGYIQNCYNTAPVSAENHGAGGIAGNGYEIQNCYNIGSVSTVEDAGGIAGFDGSAENCYNIGTVSADKNAGGIVGNAGTAENCYHTTDADNGIGNAITEVQLADKNTFATWDFTEIWDMHPLLGRPVLSSNIEGESGTESDPYVIDSLAKLEKFRDSVNLGTTYEGKFVKLAADIDLSEKYNANNNWTPIGIKGTSGNPDKPFSGTFDGNGHKISGLYIYDTSKSYQGLFGMVSGGTIKMLGVTDAQVVANQYFAGIAAYMTGGAIENCYYSGKLGANDGVYGYYGAIAGEVKESTLKNCYANAQIPDYSPNDISSGVVAGCARDNSTVSSCYFLDYDDGRRPAVGTIYLSSAENAEGKTAAQLAEQSTYIGWDFENVWTMHPILKLPTFTGSGFSGTGTEEDPYIINTLEDLEILASAVNGGNNFEKTYFALSSDIDMGKKYSAETGISWTPIGSSNYNAFSGVFDGRNHKITGLYIKDRTDNYNGLFGYISYNDYWQEGETYRAAVKNLTVSGSITGSGNYTGGLVGSIENGAVVENCGAEVDITSGSSAYNVGGLAGSCSGTVKNSFASGNVSAEGTVGGLVGSNSYGTIQNCYSLGSATGNSSVGGLAGYNEGGTIVNSYSLAKVTGGKPLIGGGWGTVKNCYYTGNIGDTSSDSVRKTRAQFESGEVAYLLSQGCTVSDDYWGDTTYDGSVWKQTVGKDQSPNFTGLALYATTGCVTYNNSGDTSEKQHSYGTDGVCDACGDYIGATLVDGVYQINNEKDLIWFAELVNSGETSVNAILNNNISFNTNATVGVGSLDISDKDSLESFTPIGNADKPYNGTFDGNGKFVSGIYIDDSDLSYAGVFGVTGENAVINNLTVQSAYVNARKYVGIISGQNNGTIKLCNVYGDVSGVYSNYDGGIVGGICGENRGIIEGEDEYNPTVFSGNVTMRDGGEYLGGIAGSNMGTIRYASNSGKIGVGENRRNVGGIAGANGSFDGGKAAIIENCTNIGSVGGDMSVGGICGANYKDAKVKSCTNGTDDFAADGKGTADAQNFAGGIVGENYGDVSQCVNHLSAKINVDSTNTESLAGGIVGENYGSISDCINRTVNVIGSKVGGIGGRNNAYGAYKGTMQYCINMVSTPVLGTCAEGADAPVNCYYYFSEGSEKYAYGEAVTDDDIGNGYVTYHLQNGREEQIWGQKINEDSMPIFTSDENKHVFKVSFTSVNGNVTERYYTYYSELSLPESQGWWTENGKLVNSGSSVKSDMELNETLYYVLALGCNIVVYAQKGTYTLIAASYDENGRLIRSELSKLTFDETGEQFHSAMLDGASIKVFLWESLESMKPLCEAAQTH